MSDIVKLIDLESKLIEYKGKLVLIDSDVAVLYGTTTTNLNKAINRNIERFPSSYMIETTKEEMVNLIFQNGISSHGGRRKPPKLFTEEGLYMVATVLKTEKATQATFAIIETFKKIRQISKNLQSIVKTDNISQQENLIENSNKLLNEVIEADIIEEGKLEKKVKKITDQFEINLGVVKFKRVIENQNKE